MRIRGDLSSSSTFTKEPGFFYGQNDVVLGKTTRTPSSEPANITVQVQHASHPRTVKIPRQTEVITQPKLFLHIFHSPWSRVTGFLREHLLFWRWKVAYLEPDQKGNQLPAPPQKILVHVADSAALEKFTGLKGVVGESLFAATLGEYYTKVGGIIECLQLPKKPLPNQNPPRLVTLFSLTLQPPSPDYTFCQIYRIRGVFSLFTYYTLKLFSSEWKEIHLKTWSGVSETVLIQKNTEPLIQEFSRKNPLALSISTSAAKA